ncbi:MAG TPA: CorA family divalent cation transporter [Caulobacterales bacterium]|nr:CorA family divalent cation transporter [Caulobacterales bacterium]
MTLPEDRATGALWAFQFEHGLGQMVADQAQRDCLTAERGWSWLHFPLSDQRARLFIERFEPAPAPVRELLLGTEHRLQLHAAEGWSYGVLPDLERDFDGRAVDIGRLYFALNERFLLTVRRHALQGVDEVRRAVETGARAETTLDLFVMLVERFIDLTEARQQHLALDLDSIEDRALGYQGDPSRLHVGPIRRELSRQHREFLGLRSAFHRAVFHRGQTQQHLLSERLPALTQQLEDFDRDAADLLERSRLLHEEIESQITATTNRSLRALTILSTLMMPPTLIVGAFGMNLTGIPWAQGPEGFWYASGFCVVIVLLAYVALKQFNILR